MVLMPIFLLFLLTHAVLIVGAISLNITAATSVCCTTKRPTPFNAAFNGLACRWLFCRREFVKWTAWRDPLQCPRDG